MQVGITHEVSRSRLLTLAHPRGLMRLVIDGPDHTERTGTYFDVWSALKLKWSGSNV